MKKILWIISSLLLSITLICCRQQHVNNAHPKTLLDTMPSDPDEVPIFSYNFYSGGNDSLPRYLKLPIPSDTLRILAIGNSYAQDGLSYLPYVLRELSPNTEVVLGIAFIPACKLELHHQNLRNHAKIYEYDKFDSRPDSIFDAEADTLLYLQRDSTYTITKNRSLHEIITDEQWDIVTFQQVSNQSFKVSTITPHLKAVIDTVRKHSTKDIHFGWILTPAYGDGYRYMPKGLDSDEMHRRICATVRNVANCGYIDFIFPIGTATQNARHTMLDALGTKGHLTHDGVHLQEGIGCLIEANTAAMVLLDMMGQQRPMNCPLLPITDKWVKASNIPGPHGKVIWFPPMTHPITMQNVVNQCVFSALCYPYKVTETLEAPINLHLLHQNNQRFNY